MWKASLSDALEVRHLVAHVVAFSLWLPSFSNRLQLGERGCVDAFRSLLGDLADVVVLLFLCLKSNSLVLLNVLFRLLRTRQARNASQCASRG